MAPEDLKHVTKTSYSVTPTRVFSYCHYSKVVNLHSKPFHVTIQLSTNPESVLQEFQKHLPESTEAGRGILEIDRDGILSFVMDQIAQLVVHQIVMHNWQKLIVMSNSAKLKRYNMN